MFHPRLAFLIILFFPFGLRAQDGSVGFTQLTSNTVNNEKKTGQQDPTAAPAGCPYALDKGSFNAARQTITGASFEEAKYSAAKAMLDANCLTADQVQQVCQLFGFEETRLNFAKAAYSRTIDPANYTKVLQALKFAASKEELNRFINSGGKVAPDPSR